MNTSNYLEGYSCEGYAYLEFYKVDSNYKMLKNQEYEIYSIDGKKTGARTILDDNNFFIINESGGLEFILNAVPEIVLEKLSNVKTLEDVDTFQEYGDNYTISNYSLFPGGQKLLQFHLPVRLRHIKAEPGYKKKDILMIMRIDARYNYNSDDLTISQKTIQLFNTGIGYYGSKFPEFNSMSDFKSSNFVGENESNAGEACYAMNDNGKIIKDNPQACTESNYLGSYRYSMIDYFMDEVGTAKLNISNTVNGVQKYDASQSKKLTYNIKIENNGSASSINNVITTYVPKNVIVVESSIGDGIYDKNSNTITWNIENIDEDEVVQLSYEANAPKDVKGELVGRTTAKSDQVELIQSRETIVTMNSTVTIIQNPNTGAYGLYISYIDKFIPMYVIVVFILVVIAVGIYFKGKMKSKITEEKK